MSRPYWKLGSSARPDTASARPQVRLVKKTRRVFRERGAWAVERPIPGRPGVVEREWFYNDKEGAERAYARALREKRAAPVRPKGREPWRL